MGFPDASQVGRFDHHITKRVTAELVNALEYLHSKKVIHRDLAEPLHEAMFL